jgi:hypothetical protein
MHLHCQVIECAVLSVLGGPDADVHTLCEPDESQIDLLEPLIDLLEPLIHLLEPLIHPLEPLIHDVEPVVDPLEPVIHLLRQTRKIILGGDVVLAIQRKMRHQYPGLIGTEHLFQSTT